jgi:hypothetical protein
MSDETTSGTAGQAEEPFVPLTPTPTPSEPVQQQVPVQQPPPPEKGTNWTAILLSFIVLILLCLVVIVVAPRVSENLNPSEPVAQEPVEVQVTLEVVVPTVERPEVEQPQPEEEAPAEGALPEGAGEGLQQICGSLGGAGGIVLLPGIFAFKRRKRAL